MGFTPVHLNGLDPTLLGCQPMHTQLLPAAAPNARWLHEDPASASFMRSWLVSEASELSNGALLLGGHPYNLQQRCLCAAGYGASSTLWYFTPFASTELRLLDKLLDQEN